MRAEQIQGIVHRRGKRPSRRQTHFLQDIASAANHLATLGIFKKVRYQYSNNPTEISVQFHVDEETDLLPGII